MVSGSFLQRKGAGAAMRRNIALCIVFSIITFGIYEIYWFIVATNEINRMTRHPNQTSGGIAFLLTLITFGCPY